MEEFKEIVLHAGLISEQFSEKDAYAVFGMSIMTSIDEINNDRHI